MSQVTHKFFSKSGQKNAHFHTFLQDDKLGSGNTRCPHCETWLQGRPYAGVCADLQKRVGGKWDKQQKMTKYCRRKGIGDPNCKHEFMTKTQTQIIAELRAQLSSCTGEVGEDNATALKDEIQRLKDEIQRLMKQNEELMQQNTDFDPSSLNWLNEPFDFSNEPLSPISNSSSSSSSEEALRQENTHLRQQLDKVRQQLSTLLQDIPTF